MLMYVACYFPSIVFILAKTSLLYTIAAIGHVTRVKTSPLILTAGEGGMAVLNAIMFTIPSSHTLQCTLEQSMK